MSVELKAGEYVSTCGHFSIDNPRNATICRYETPLEASLDDGSAVTIRYGIICNDCLRDFPLEELIQDPRYFAKWPENPGLLTSLPSVN